MWEHKYLVTFLLSTLPDIYLEGKSLDHMEILFSIFGGTTIVLSTAAAPLYIPINAQVSQLPHILADICWLLHSSRIDGCERCTQLPGKQSADSDLIVSWVQLNSGYLGGQML